MTSCVSLQKNLHQKLQHYVNAPRWVVAFSGGLDSTVLLHALSSLKKTYPNLTPEIIALHVNHQLNPNAQEWEKHCREVCDGLGITFFAQKVSVSSAGEGLEAAARSARYHVFTEFLREGDVLLQAHHANDQAETVILRLLRGAGVTGLSAIPKKRSLSLPSNECAQIVRPLLNISRQQLQCYAEDASLRWVEDDSNYDVRFDRNFLRQDILPRLAERWPAVVSVLSRTATQMAHDSQLLREFGDSDWQACVAEAASGEQALVIPLLLEMSPARRNNAVRSWLMVRDLPVPDFAMMQRLVDEVLMARADAEPCLQWGDVEAHRYANRLFIFKCLPPIETNKQFVWNTTMPLTIDGVGMLSMSEPHAEVLSVRFRQGGERCRPMGRAHSQSLKKLFQEYRVPPWFRDRVPLIYRHDELVAVAGWWNCEGSGLPALIISAN